ncbi:hypothetical protein [Flavisolibacter nicotianae]|uniref:hypothetical protein n=1 Tax=Flavisolibacter nicotianae TaxID=2364882 RepID=UPI000EAFF835|nr:hypothetical protein [Flavisolibacter nicotianae]
MRKILFPLLLLITTNAFSQIDHIKVLIGRPESAIREYFDSLNHLKSNPAYRIDRDVAENGDLMLSVSFSLKDEDFYTCIGIAVVFIRISGGEEICRTQVVHGSSKNAQPNLAYIKDNYKYIKENYWERAIAPGAKIGAEFKSEMVNNHSSYTIAYWAIME